MKTYNKLIFVVGNSRSGTTMMLRILNKHPEISAFNELHFFEELCSLKDMELDLTFDSGVELAARILCIMEDGYTKQGDSSRFINEAKCVIKSIPNKKPSPAEVFKSVLFCKTLSNSKTIPCEKTPQNVFYIGEILRLYPDARIINMVRDPRNILLSQKRKWKRKSMGAKNISRKEAIRLWFNYHPITISKLWNSSIKAAVGFSDHSRICTVRFEDILSNPVKELRNICNFIWIPFYDSMLDISLVSSSHAPNNPYLIGVDQQSAGNWLNGGLDSTEVFMCQRICHVFMENQGYHCERISPNPIRLMYYFLSFPIKLIISLFLNLNRTQNILETLKRRLQHK